MALFCATFAVYAQVSYFEFVNYDDPDYVTHNPHVQQGITADGVAWALTSGDDANWFPLTRISHMLDYQLFGLRSGMHHLTNVLIHALAALLLFAFLQRATGSLAASRWPSAFVALLFALHPLHVESVAWVAERKDVLNAFFWFATLYAYARYAERPTVARYLWVLGLFCLGLMTKPMIVTLPFAMLLLDVWPLRRPAFLWREKLPFFALSAAAAVETYLVQRHAGAVETLTVFPLGLRIENALVSYAVYLVKMFWPARLAVFYPYPAQIAGGEIAAAVLAIAAVSIAAIRWRRAHPYLAVGWFWYLGTLVPVIGLVQAGTQARADRYTYIPMVGLSIMLAWGVADAVRRWPRIKPAMIAAAAVACASCAGLTWAQTQYWSDSTRLFQHAIDVTEDVTQGNALAHHNLGVALASQPGRLNEAVAEFRAALRIQPDYPKALTDLGNALSRIPGRADEAAADYRAAVRMAPDSAIPHNNLGNTLAQMPGRLDEAIAEYRAALRIDPNYAAAHNNLGSALARKPGELSAAITEWKTALRIDPNYAEAHNNLGRANAETPGLLNEAIAQYETALRLKPDYAEAHRNLADVLTEVPGRQPDAIAHYRAALALEPDSAEAHYDLGLALSKTGAEPREAIDQFETALRLNPAYAEAHNNLGVVLTNIPGRLPDAIAHFEAAVRAKPEYADAQYNLGAALSNVPGRVSDAIEHLQAAERLKPDPETQQALARLRGRR